MKAYSEDLRRRVLDDCDAGLRSRAAAAKYRESDTWVRRLKQRRRKTGEILPLEPIRAVGEVADIRRPRPSLFTAGSRT